MSSDKPMVIVIAWTDMTGSEPTGRTVRRNGYDRPEFVTCAAPHALVWSRDPADRAAGQAYAQANGYHLMVLEDTDEVLDRARDLVMARHRAGKS